MQALGETPLRQPRSDQQVTMQLSNYILFAAIEVYLVLVIIGTLLLFQVRKQRQLIRRQQEKLLALIEELKRLKLPPPAAVMAPGTSYKTYLQAQQAATRNRLKGLGSDADIQQLLTTGAPIEQQALALRHWLLQIEETAIDRGDGPLQINWSQLEEQLAQLLNSITAQSDEGIPRDDELATYKKRIDNLEKFKKLFFEMEKQWQNAHKQAEDYYTQLSAMAKGVDDPDEFTNLLDRYHNVYQDIDQNFVYGSNNFAESASTETKTITVNRIDPRAGEEIIKLRNVAADQHRIINQLQRKLEDAETPEAKAAVVNELQHQLQRQTRFVQESETCIKLLEDELASASEKLNHQQQQLDASAASRDENIKLKEALEKFTLESKDLIKSLLDLEKENAALKRNAQTNNTSATSSASGNGEPLKKLEAEYLALQQEFAQLEEKYLELKLR